MKQTLHWKLLENVRNYGLKALSLYVEASILYHISHISIALH